MNIIEFTKTLIEIPSESGNERQIGEFLAARLKNNFKITLQQVGERFNILATRGEPKLLLTTHIDTVPGILEIKEDFEWLYGRGACDAKGIIAAMIFAAEGAVKEGFTNFGLLFDVSEESDFSGIKEAVQLVNPDFVIVGEPTGLRIVIGQKGLLGIKVKSFGKAAPGSLPEQGISAITKIMKALNRLNNLVLPANEPLGKTTLNIGQVQGGTAPNVVPDYAEAVVEIRTTISNNFIVDLVKKELSDEEIEILYNFESKQIRDPNLLKELNLERITVPYFTEMYFWASKSPTIVLGPGEYSVAHTKKERINKKDLVKGKEIYFEIIKNYAQKKRQRRNKKTN